MMAASSARQPAFREPVLLLLQLCSCCTLTLASNTTSPEEEEQEVQLKTKYATQSRHAIILLLSLSVLVFFAMFLYQRVTRGRSELAERELQRLRTTDEYLFKMLKNFSIQHLEDNKFRGIQKKLQPANLGFEDIKCTVWNGSEHQVVLEDISGSFQAGHLSAIMGPSGSGKTTLIDVLTGKKHSDQKWTVTGRVLINDLEQSFASLKPVTGFVPQDDVVHEGLTVRENIAFSAWMRMPAGTTRCRIKKITDDVLQVLQLESRQNMLVGNRVKTGEGLSGGQTKRVNVGIELAACPTILFLDEPTSGLDATASLMLVQQLKRMARLGMTIIMIIHQPRYSLFTLLDDVLLLGTCHGGRLAYIGPTTKAKPYFERLGIHMPSNENPADWMMDVLCGQVDQKDCRIPKSQIPKCLFEKWKAAPALPDEEELPSRSIRSAAGMTWQRSNGSSSISRRVSEEDDIEVIKRHCKDDWTSVLDANARADKETFAKVLRSCTGATPDEEITAEIMRRARCLSSQGRTHLDLGQVDQQPENGDEDVITLQVFEDYMLYFRGIESKDSRLRGLADRMLQPDFEESSSDDDDDSGQDEEVPSDGESFFHHFCHRKAAQDRLGDLHRVQAGFCVHLKCVLHAALLSFWRKMDIKMLFIIIIMFAAAFLAVFDRFIFKSPPWLPTNFINAQISLALLVSVYCLQLFSNDQPMYWREASHGLDRTAFLIGRSLVDTLDWLLMTFFFVLVYYVIANPILQFYVYIWPFVLVGYVASGWGYAISCCLPSQYGPFISSLLSFTMGGILGLPMQMGVYLDGGFLEVMVDSISYTRWSGAMSFLVYLADIPPDPDQLDYINKSLLTLYKNNYAAAKFLLPMEDSLWWTGMMSLLLQGSVLRVIAYFGLRFTNRDRQI